MITEEEKVDLENWLVQLLKLKSNPKERDCGQEEPNCENTYLYICLSFFFDASGRLSFCAPSSNKT